MAYEILKKVIKDSSNIVLLSGLGLLREIGIPNFRDDQEAYDVEVQYGYSPEDIFSSSFYSTRPDIFFKYYKEKILFLFGQPNEAFHSLVRLEQQGKLKAIVTRNIYGLHKIAGSQNVIELHGSVHNNSCIRCGTNYPAIYIKNSPGIPRCEKCQGAIRPGVGFYGDMIDNGKLTKAASAIGEAETLIVAGTHLNSYLAERFLQYYTGSQLVLINNETHFSDEKADIVIHDEVCNVLPQVIE